MKLGVIVFFGFLAALVLRPYLQRTTVLSVPDAKQPKGIVIFLVREDALDTYFAAYNIARGRYARAGKLPVIGQGQIDLSVFNELKKK